MVDYAAPQRLTVAQIQAAVCQEFKITPHDMASSRRAREIARPRQIAMYLSSQLTYLSMPRIGHFFGGMDHTTVMHAIRRITALMAEDEMFALRVTALEARLQSPEVVEHF
jgi:chromosomal replication initiator protein